MPAEAPDCSTASSRPETWPPRSISGHPTSLQSRGVETVMVVSPSGETPPLDVTVPA